MLRFFALLISISLTLSTGAAAALAICQHQDAQAHGAARLSNDASIASVAMAEETAERTASQAGSVGDQVQVPVGAFLVPAAQPVLQDRERRSLTFVPDRVLEPPARPIEPPERPPHS